MEEKENRKYDAKVITIRVKKDLLKKMSKIREDEGISITFQLHKGAEMYLKTKEK